MKHLANVNIEKLKVRFVVKGLSQKYGIDNEETFSLVAEYTSIREVASLISFIGWRIHQVDVKITFLNGIIEEEVYIMQLQGFEVNGKESQVFKLKKALYGLK
jgi:hypothetical protein